ncbi:hypothetical protein PLICRDRAFT_103790 [Plicaturopsis crispa FD-325 SS-3]|nr:hypothetical protein PLICRDRAFT_103790 [Plicaturopsis crispa FD-325 SS-3]
MDHPTNGIDLDIPTALQKLTNGNGLHTNGIVASATNDSPEATLEELERELPVVHDGQVFLGDLLSRVTQGIYAELSELADTMPNMSDSARKRTLADWVVKTKKQVVKLYAVAKWARDAGTVQKCMNITAFLMNQNQQFENAMMGLNAVKDGLDPARLRNHDLLTSLDVLTTGSYRRLPSGIKKLIVPATPLTDAEVVKTLRDMEDVMRYRLRMDEIVPVEMAHHEIADGRVHFSVPKLFDASLCLRGAQKGDGWFFVRATFPITVGGDLTGMQEFPREPTGILRRHITDEADARLAFYLPLPADYVQPPGVEIPPRPQLPDGVVDTPLVRVFNFLQMMSMSYQLEILWYQAQRMRSLGWADYLTIEMTNTRKTLTASYWVRPPLPPGRPAPRSSLPQLGGTLTISIVESHSPPQTGGGPARSPKDRVMAELQQKAKLGGRRPSDEVEGLKFEVRWEPSKGALGVAVSPADAVMDPATLSISVDCLDFEALLRKVIERHTKCILAMYQFQLQRGPTAVFSIPGEVTLVIDGDAPTLRAHLCADEVVVITIDPRTGRLNLRDTGDLAAVGRGPRFAAISYKLNDNPEMLFDALNRLRIQTITDLAEQKAQYLGLQSFRDRNFATREIDKLGPDVRGTLFIQLSSFPNHYLVLVIMDMEFRYALISVTVASDTMFANMVMEDIGWLDVTRIHGGEDVVVTSHTDHPDLIPGQKRKRDLNDDAGRNGSFNLETQVLRELYAYCCARVAYTKVESQFKMRVIPYTHVNPPAGGPLPLDLAHIQSSLSRSVPALCVKSSDILSGAPAAEAAMPNIRVIPLNWWSAKKAQVVTCVKLKYVQQPMGKRAGTSNIIRPSKRIIYDASEAVVSFLSENVDNCVDEFLEEWAKVSKMVVIAREVAQMAKDKIYPDIRLLSFDLQTVEFAYAEDYTVSITCVDQLSPSGGSFDLRFSRCSADPHARPIKPNPHANAESFLHALLRHGRLAPSLHRLVALLRDTLPIAVELEDIRTIGEGVDTYTKAAGWYRVLYGDLRHALDFRLMSNQRAAILDGSHSLFRSTDATSPPSTLGLQPIPGFSEIVQSALKDLTSQGELRGNFVPVDVGVVCEVGAVRVIGRALHDRVLKRLKA